MFLGKNLHVDESSSPVTHIKMHTIFCSASPRRDGRRRVPTIWSDIERERGQFWAGRAWRLGPTSRGGRSRTRSRRAGAPPAAGSGGPPAAAPCPTRQRLASRCGGGGSCPVGNGMWARSGRFGTRDGPDRAGRTRTANLILDACRRPSSRGTAGPS